jgi:hypothetical protein
VPGVLRIYKRANAVVLLLPDPAICKTLCVCVSKGRIQMMCFLRVHADAVVNHKNVCMYLSPTALQQTQYSTIEIQRGF